ncbi:MAG: hypothetical protein ACT4OM_09825 [Actinomycetota bacterium]
MIRALLLSMVWLMGVACGSERTVDEAEASGSGSDSGATGAGAPSEEVREDLTNRCSEGTEESSGSEGGVPAQGARPVDVTATDHSFGGVQGSYPAGNFKFGLTGGGEELHELAVMMVSDATRPIDQLLRLEAEGAEFTLSYLGGTTACPGQTSDPFGLTLAPGRYAFVCYIATGNRPDVPPERLSQIAGNPPHWAKGMFHELKVTAV